MLFLFLFKNLMSQSFLVLLPLFLGLLVGFSNIFLAKRHVQLKKPILYFILMMLRYGTLIMLTIMMHMFFREGFTYFVAGFGLSSLVTFVYAVRNKAWI